MGKIGVPRAALRVILGGLGIGVAACSDSTGIVSPKETQTNGNTAAPTTELGEFNTVGRFAVTGSVAGDLRPGGIIRVTANIRANFATNDAALKILAPEVALLRAKRFEGSGRLTGMSIAPEVASRVRFGRRGEERSLATTLTIGEPGYYRVLVAALAPTDPPTAGDGTATIQNAVYDEIWFTVTDDGGRVTGTYDRGVFPAGMAERPGPFRPLLPAPAADTERGIAGRAALMSDPMTLQLSYWNRDASAWEPVVDAKYRLVVSTGGTYTGQTNGNGEFTFPCATGGATGMLDVWYESAGKVSVIRHGTVGTLAFHSGIAVTICGGYTSAAVDQSLNGNAAARVFTNALITVNTSRVVFPARAAITYKMSTNVPDTKYVSSDDHIQIDTGHTWGSYGIFGAAHEYGHALHNTALGGLKDDSGTCTVHNADGYYNYGCAYKEGFADYHAAVVRGAAGDFFTWTRDGLFHNGQNGATNEIGVSSFLYDLTDPAGDESFDAVQYPTWYVADIYRTCDTHYNIPPLAGWQRAHGIDHMVYCFEQTVDPTATVFFRGGVYNAEAETATEPSGWNQTAIRNLWLRNMFNQ